MLLVTGSTPDDRQMDVLLPQHIEYCSALMSNLRLNGYWTDTVNIGGQEPSIVADSVDSG